MVFFLRFQVWIFLAGTEVQRRTKRVRKGIYNRCSGNDIPFWRMIVEEELHWLEEEKAELNKKKGIVV